MTESAVNHENLWEITHTLPCLTTNLHQEIESRRTGNPNGALVIGIGGYSCLGKSRLAQSLANLHRPVTILPTDCFITRTRHSAIQEGITSDNPEVIDLEGLASAIAHLRLGESVMVTDYDKATGSLLSPRQLVPTTLVIVEGSSALYPKLVSKIDFKIFLDADIATRASLQSAVRLSERGYTQAMLDRMWPLFLRDQGNYVGPSRDSADFVIQVDPSRRYQSNLFRSCNC